MHTKNKKSGFLKQIKQVVNILAPVLKHNRTRVYPILKEAILVTETLFLASFMDFACQFGLIGASPEVQLNDVLIQTADHIIDYWLKPVVTIQSVTTIQIYATKPRKNDF